MRVLLPFLPFPDLREQWVVLNQQAAIAAWIFFVTATRDEQHAQRFTYHNQHGRSHVTIPRQKLAQFFSLLGRDRRSNVFQQLTCVRP
jgi:hypothetical protein